MLILTRRRYKTILIDGGKIKITVLDIQRGQVKLGTKPTAWSLIARRFTSGNCTARKILTSKPEEEISHGKNSIDGDKHRRPVRSLDR